MVFPNMSAGISISASMTPVPLSYTARTAPVNRDSIPDPRLDLVCIISAPSRCRATVFVSEAPSSLNFTGTVSGSHEQMPASRSRKPAA